MGCWLILRRASFCGWKWNFIIVKSSGKCCRPSWYQNICIRPVSSDGFLASSACSRQQTRREGDPEDWGLSWAVFVLFSLTADRFSSTILMHRILFRVLLLKFFTITILVSHKFILSDILLNSWKIVQLFLFAPEFLGFSKHSPLIRWLSCLFSNLEMPVSS